MLGEQINYGAHQKQICKWLISNDDTKLMQTDISLQVNNIAEFPMAAPEGFALLTVMWKMSFQCSFDFQIATFYQISFLVKNLSPSPTNSSYPCPLG